MYYIHRKLMGFFHRSFDHHSLVPGYDLPMIIYDVPTAEPQMHWLLGRFGAWRTDGPRKMTVGYKKIASCSKWWDISYWFGKQVVSSYTKTSWLNDHHFKIWPGPVYQRVGQEIHVIVLPQAWTLEERSATTPCRRGHSTCSNLVARAMARPCGHSAIVAVPKVRSCWNWNAWMISAHDLPSGNST